LHYRLSLAKPLKESVQAIAAAQIDGAIARLKAMDRDGTAIHAARRHFKRTRALLDLVAPATRGSIAKTGRRRLILIARKLGASRDAQVATGAAEGLERDFGKGANARAFSDLISFLKARQDRAGEILHQEGVKPVLTELKKTKANLLKLNLHGDMPILIDSASKTYRRGRREIREAFETGNEDKLHECRKLVQRHWRQLILLKDLWPKEAKARIALARRLSDALGMHHDLAVLRETILSNRIAFRSPDDVTLFCRCIMKKQDALARKVARRAKRLYAQKPKLFSKCLHACWRSAERERSPKVPASGLKQPALNGAQPSPVT
jgi:CHAD domain-containing protein